MKTTIKDIAKACDVSKTTVSRFLNNSGYVSKEVSDRITAKIEELNYVPSTTARSLSLQKSNVLGVIIPEVSNPFFGEVFKGISEIADDNDLSIFYCDTDNNRDKELKALATLRGHDICGVILTPATGGLVNGVEDEAFIKALENLNVPIVLLDRDVDYKSFDGVFIDNYKGAYESTKLLIQNGHTNIATICGDQKLFIGKERLRGYKAALNEEGILNNDSLIIEGDFSIQKGYEGTLQLLGQENKPTAIFSPNNLTTMGVLKALTELNLTFPEDIAVVGFDDIELLKMLNIDLTVVHRDTVEMGNKAMELLLSMIKNNHNETSQRIIIEPELIVRGSEKKVT